MQQDAGFLKNTLQLLWRSQCSLQSHAKTVIQATAEYGKMRIDGDGWKGG